MLRRRHISPRGRSGRPPNSPRSAWSRPCSDTGGWYRIDNFEHWWGVWRKEHGFEGLKFHELRHTQATQLLANGVDVKTVQTRLGHANASITLGWYAHAIPEKDHEAADLLGNLLASNAPTSENAVEASRNGVETEDEKNVSTLSPAGAIRGTKEAGQPPEKS